MMDKQLQVRRSIALVSLALALAIGGALAWWVMLSTHTIFGAHDVATFQMASVHAAAGTANVNEGYSSVAEPLLPMVVNISTSKVVKSPHNLLPFFNDPFFRQFFGDQFGQQPPREQRERSLGSGVVVSPDGYILTNNHVVEGASDVQVTLSDKRRFKAKVAGTDPRSDLAVLKVPAMKLPSVTLGNSSKMRVGDIVLAIGDPFGVGETVTMGIVSATGRKGLGIEGPEGYEDFIQTDAAINPGNSGGALVNMRGELIGINTAIIAGGGGGNQGIGFAIPIDMARGVMEQILKSGKVTRGYIGVGIQEVTPDLAKVFGVPSAEGALVGSVTPEGPGARAGLQKGDVITTLNDKAISDYRDLRLQISQMAPGTAVKLGILRSGQKREMTVTLAEYPEKAAAAMEPALGETTMEGVQVGALTSEIARELNLPPNTRGVVITNVEPDSPGSDAGLQRGDVIQEVDRKAVSNLNEFQAEVREAGKKPLLLLVNRGGNTLFVVISPR
jgi:serine protease Do